MMPNQKLAPPRPGSLANRLYSRYGSFFGELLLNAYAYGFSVVLLIYVLVIVACVAIVVDSASLISPPLTTITLVIALIAFFWIFGHLLRASNPQNIEDFLEFLARYLSSERVIVVLSFIQTFFWMIDSTNSRHEPRSVFLLSTSLLLLTFRDRVLSWTLKLLERRAASVDESDNTILPFDEVQ
jgi:membrane-bound acyltransferase YfiQ involved in biofilm formation